MGSSNDDIVGDTRPSPSRELETQRWASAEWRVPSPGYLLDGQYRVLSTLSEGAMGVVIEARDVRLRRRVAIKIIRPELLRRPRAGEAFESEARLCAKVSHPAVVGIHSLGHYGPSPYMVLEFIRGETLESYLEESGGRLEVLEALRILRPIGAGIDAIHRAGALHRDIKPANVMLGERGTVKIIDLGVGEEIRKARGGLAGTPRYISPEVAGGAAAGPPADIYALAVMTYQMLCGSLPFDSDSVADLLAQHSMAPVPSMLARRPELPKRLDDIVRLGLSKTPDARPSSGAAFVGLVEGALVGSYVADHPSLSERAPVFLVVEDDAGVRGFVEDVLSSEFPGATVIGVASGHEGFERALEDIPDLIISDLRMRDGDGRVMLRELGAHPCTCDTPIVVMTGRGSAEGWRDLRGLGARALLVKPFDPMELLSTVKRLLRSSALPGNAAAAGLDPRWGFVLGSASEEGVD